VTFGLDQTKIRRPPDSEVRINNQFLRKVMKYLGARTTAISVCLLVCSIVAVWHYSENSSSAAAGCGTPSFAVVVTPNVNNFLNAVAMGDLNGDTKPDLVTANEFNKQVTILVGDGAGNFAVSSTMATSSIPFALVLGDFNGDTKLDLAVSLDSTTVSLYLGTGSATFSGPTSFTVGTNPLRLVSADFNNDGKLDLATGNDGSNTISILLGNGSGGFAPTTSIANVRPASLVVADFNHDNKPDIAAANFVNNKVTVMLGDGAGGFGPLNHFDGGSSLQGIASADFNNDTNPDIVVTNNECCNPAFVAVLLGNGSGSFGAPTKFSTPLSPFAVVTGDFNGDSNADVATVNVQQTSSNVSVLTGNGAGALSAPTNFNVGATPIRIITGDVNLDNAPDLVVTSPPNVAALLNACGGAPTPTPTATPTPSPTPTPVPTPAQGDVVISQVYSGGGNPGSTYQNNFIELFNRTDHSIDISGWPLWFATAAGSFDNGVAFVSSRGIGIAPHGYILIALGPASANGAPVNFDLQITASQINLSPTTGKVLLSRPNSTFFGSTCPLPDATIVDFVGYGTAASCFEGNGPTSNLGNTTAALRKYNGCLDSNNNAGDFLVGAPNPHNSQSPASSCVNPIDGADFFVRQHYSDFLNRQPDAPGLAFWTNEITSCGVDGQCVDLKRTNVSAAFFLSIEFRETGYLVERLYKAAYGDVNGSSTNGGTLHQLQVPVVRFNEFLPDSQQLGQGVVVGQSGWEQVLENNKLSFLSQFVTRMRFTTAYPATLTPAQFVDGLFAHTGVTPSTADRTSIINEFGGAATSADNAARARALRRVAEYPAFDQLEKNKAFVLIQYFGYLRRNPNDPPDTDYTGYDFWLTKLRDFNGDYIKAEMVRAFLLSSEYRQRFGP
jgi:hypothetical protein